MAESEANILYIVLRFVKPILLNEYDDDKTTHVCTLYSPTCYTSSGVGSSAVRNNSLNFTPAHWLIKRELLFIQRMKGCR